MAASKRRKVKSEAADAHERAKDYLDPPEMERLLEAAKKAVPIDHQDEEMIADAVPGLTCSATPAAIVLPT